MRNKIFLIILLLFTLFLLLPQLQIPWMIVDDGESARASAELSQHFASGDIGWLFKFEAHNGLLRPSYWLLHWLNFSLFGLNAALHHFSHLLLFLGIAVLVFFLTKEISEDWLAGLLAGLFLLLFAPAAENFYRLGTGEPGLVLFLLGTIYFLVKAIKKNSWFLFYLSLIFLVFSWFAKATVIILIPGAIFIFFIFLLFPEKRYPQASKFCFIFLLLNLVLALAVKWTMAFYQIEGGYGSQYQIDLDAIGTRLNFYLKMITRTYGPIIYLVLASFLWRLFLTLRIKKSKIFWRDKWELTMFGFFTLFFLIQTPWPHLMGRYLPPALIGLSIIAGMESSFIFGKGIEFFRQRKYLSAGLLIFPLVVFMGSFVLSNALAISKMYSEVIPGEKKRAEVVSFLAQNTPENGRIFYNFSDGVVEFLYEMGLHFKIFHDRPDIKTAYLFLDNGFEFKKSDIIVTGPPYSYRYPWEQVKEILNYEQELKSFGDGWEIIEISKDEVVLPAPFATTPEEKRIYLTEKSFSFVDGEKPARVPVSQLPLTGGKISFLWRPPIDIAWMNKKIPLVRQGERGEILPKGLFVWAGRDYLTFGIFDPWRNQWRLLPTQYEFLPGRQYEIILSWGKTGMTLQAGESYQFLPYYAGLNPKEDLILGPVPAKQPDFEKELGEIKELRVFSQ